MNDDQSVSLGSKVIFEFIFLVFNIVYLVKLEFLNRTLKQKVDTSKAFKVVMYNNGQPYYYVLGAVVLVILSLILAIWFWNTTIKERYLLEFVILSIVTTILNIACIVLIWILINNPILRAVLIIIVIGVLTLVSISQT